jgi:hypothetical protein
VIGQLWRTVDATAYRRATNFRTAEEEADGIESAGYREFYAPEN